MHCPSFPFLLFFVAVAELLLTDSDQTSFPDLVPPTLPNSPSPIPITPDIAFGSDSGNMVPVDLNPVAATPNEMFSLNSKVAQEPSKDIETETSIEPAYIDANTFDAGNSLPACNSVGSTAGRKLRREQGEQCAPEVSSPEVPWQTRINDFLHQLVGDDPPSQQEPTHRKNPKGALTEEEIEEMEQKDRTWRTESAPKANDPYWQTPQGNPCGLGDPRHSRPACCLGPPREESRLRANSRPIINQENCVLYVFSRPFCTILGPLFEFCCDKIDYQQDTQWGWMGIDCIPMWAGYGPDGLRLRVDP